MGPAAGRRARRRARTDRQDPERATPWPRASSLFCLALAFLLALSSFGTYVNDEAAQLQGLHNLRQGSFDLEDRPRQFYAIMENVFLPGVNESAQPNPLVSMVALPAYGAFWVASFAASAPTVLLFGWTAAAYVAATRGWARAYEWRTGRAWSWYKPTPGDDGASWGARAATRLRSMTPTHWFLVAALAVWTLAQWAQLPSVDHATWGETFAVQATHILLGAAGFVLFFRVVQNETCSLRAASLAGAALLLGPYAVWGIGIKYHAPSMVLTIATLWLYQRPDRWRYAAFATAAVGVALTPLGAPVFGALVLVEAVRAVGAARHGETRTLARAGAAVAAGALLLWAFVALVPDHRLSLALASIRDASLGDWLKENLRYENARTSLVNLWRVFVDSRLIQGSPVAVWALTPLAALALLSPLRLRGQWSRTLGLAAAAAVLFMVMFVHAAHTQGDGRDNRFFATVLPALLLLGAVVLARRVDAVEHERWRPLRRYGVLVGAVVVLLLVLAAAGVELVPDAGWRQLLRASWLLGTASWVALVALEAFHAAWLKRFGDAAVERAWGWATAAMLVPGTVWLFHVLVFTNRILPPWPFGSDAEGMGFLMPSLDGLRNWWLEALLP